MTSSWLKKPGPNLKRKERYESMAINLASLQTVVPKHPPRIFIYGPPGIGKTSLANDFPSPVFLQTEDSAVQGVALQSFGHLTAFAEVMEAVTVLYNDDHNFRTVVLDTVDALQPLVWQATCERNNWPDIEAPGYGKGYLAADDEWRDFLKGLNALRTDRFMNILLVGHSEIDRFDDPQTTSYSRFDFRGHKRSHAIIEDEMDAILFLNQDPSIKLEDAGFGKKRARAEGGNSTWIYTERRPVWNAKNRYNMPPRLLYEKGKGYEVMAQYLPGQEPPKTEKTKKVA